MAVDILSEPRIYGPANPENSYWRDLALQAVPAEPGHSEAVTRLRRHADEIEKTAGTSSDEGRRALRGIRNVNRAETRAGMTTGTSSGGTFVTPEYFTNLWATFRAANRSFVNQTTAFPLPEYGLAVHIPSFSSAPTVAQQLGENQAVADAEPTGTDITTPLVTEVGQVSLSQQLHDRGGMDGLSFDMIVQQQLMSQLNAAIDTYVINQALANAGSVTDATFSMANFYADLAKGREQMTDTAGVRLMPTHLFTTSDMFSYITRQVDSQNRPIVTPDSNALVQAAGDPRWEAWTGIHLPGALQWHTDDNIPVSGSNTQLIVARPSEIFTFDGEHIAYSFVETNAQELSVVVGLRAYVAAIVRFPKAIASISGAAYPTSDV